MKNSKIDLGKEKSKSKAPCSSKQASKFLEKEGFGAMPLNFKGLSINLNDFIPNEFNGAKGIQELDFEIASQMKKLEKKDACTKQKALIELNDLINNKSIDSVAVLLKYWPKVYNRLSVDEDKGVRELIQEIMKNLSRLCGKSLGPFIKQLLPSWIFAQADIHGTAAAIAKNSFELTFPNEDRRQKAYLLCWQEISSIINSTILKGTTLGKGESLNREKKHKNKEESKVIEDKNANKDNVKLLANEEVQNSCKKDDASYNETYQHELVLHLRTLITLMPYISNDIAASHDLSQWLHTKHFWAHYKTATSTNILSVYLSFSISLLTHMPKLVLETPFIISNITYSLRLVDNYHVNIVPLVWALIMKYIDTLGESLWQHVSFQNTFLPKWLKMLECGVDGRVSLAASFMLPFFSKLPVHCMSVYGRIFDSMTKGLSCSRIRNVYHEANCFMSTILECATYTILRVKFLSSDDECIKDKILIIIWRLLESYLTNPEYNRADKTVANFCNIALRPLVNKEVITSSDVIQTLKSWVDLYHENIIFSEHLTELLIELSNMSFVDTTFCFNVINTMQVTLLDKVVNQQHCLLPYLSVVSSNKATITFNDKLPLQDVFRQCTQIISPHTSSVINTISSAMANMLNNLPNEAGELYRIFLKSLSEEQTWIFFDKYYSYFISHIHENILNLVVIETLSFWKVTLLAALDILPTRDEKGIVPKILPIIFHHCQQSIYHSSHLASILHVLESFIDLLVTGYHIDILITIVTYCIEEMSTNFSLDLLPRSIILNLVKMYTCSTTALDLSPLRLVLQHHSNNDSNLTLSLEIVDHLISCCDGAEVAVVADILSLVIIVAPPLPQKQQNLILDHLDKILRQDAISLDRLFHYQQRYSSSIIDHKSLTGITHKLYIILNLDPSLIMTNTDSCYSLKTTVTHCCLLLTPVLLSTFSSCHHSTHVLKQCELIYKLTQTISPDELAHIIDCMLISSQSTCNLDSTLSTLDQCPHLVLMALKHFIPVNYSQWSHSVLSSVDLAINSWTDLTLSHTQISLMFHVLFPCALRARYLIQEIILATIASFLTNEDDCLTIKDINRTLLLIKSLVTTDPSFFSVCFPLLINVKHRFESQIDQLHDAVLDSNLDDTFFDLSSLLEILTIGVDSSVPLERGQWDFVLCLIRTLSRSQQFVNSGDFAATPLSGNRDRLFNSCLLLRLISITSINLASDTINETVLDEWENFFSEPLFTTVLDMFSLLAGDHSQGRLVSSPLFTFYTEALAEVVSLCPVSVLLAHNFSSQIHVNDPVQLPKDFLIVLNSLLESLSSYSLSIQMAAYNCLLNLTDHFSGLLSDQITALEADDSSLDSFTITLPHHLLSYLQCDHLLNLTADRLENEVVLTRCFLAWSVLLQLFSTSPPKVRAEITTFLSTHNRCFDKFLIFCFGFMPKNPIINKRQLSFLAVHGKQNCNLISEEPEIFSRCLEHRSKFIIYHLASYVFRRSVQVLPNLARGWFMSLDSNSQQLVDVYVRQNITPELMKIEFGQLKRAVVNDFDEKLEIQALPVIGEVVVRYIVSDGQCLEQVINLPKNYPIGKVCVDFKKEMKVKIPHWKSWIIQMTSTMENQNGSILDGVKLWKKNLDNHFNGVEECMICYSILHAIKYRLPSMKCRQCKKKFHKECMHKWFQSSTNPTCPNCRNVFYDGTYKRTQYGDTDI